jgi:hypothetical protein
MFRLMPRDPKPWFRKDRDAWFVTINGRRFNLGSDRDAAHTRFHELMLTGGDDRPLDESDLAAQRPFHSGR